MMGWPISSVIVIGLVVLIFYRPKKSSNKGSEEPLITEPQNRQITKS